jgi:hypothetical protein
MARLMSVRLTEQQVRDRTKTVTRRLGWLKTEPGDRVTLCPKVMGRKPGEPLVRLAEVEVVNVRRERLEDMPLADLALEGFPEFTTIREFVEFFCTHMRCEPDTEVTRIEWKYLPATVSVHA